jgi:membrane protease YdiL (CAAX protease family)
VAGDRLTGSDKRALVLWVVAGVLGALFAYKYYFQAFPEASVNFQISRDQAQRRAEDFVTGLGENVGGYQSTIVFNVDENAKTYMERELGLQQANQLMSAELNVWYWDVRFFRPEQLEEFHVHVSTAGQIVGYDRHIEENRPGASLEREGAQTLAQSFLAGKLGQNLHAWELLSEEANSLRRPKRTDWSFTWEKRGFRAKDAPYRLEVGVQGDRVGGSKEFLKVPEAWERGYAQLRARNIFYNQVAILPYLLLIGSAVWVGISLSRRGLTSWSGAIRLGGLIAAFFFLMELNQWQATRSGYDTTHPYSSFVVLQLAAALLGALGTGLMVTLVLPGGEPLYRASQPANLRLGAAFTLRGFRTKEFFSAAVVGLSLAAAHIGFIVAFYMFGSKVGVWAPQDLNYSDTINTSFPWIAGVAIGLLAATSEEFLFRLFAIPFLHKITKSRWLAILLPAFAWSFLHSAYPQEPPYIRGLEVGLIGIVAGIVMLRWGILATLIWHYTVDASLVGLLLIRSNSLYFKTSGIIVGLAAAAPLALSAISYLRRGSFEANEDLLNSAEPLPEISPAPATMTDAAAVGTSGRRYRALAPAMLGVLAAGVLTGGLAAWRVKTPAIGDYLQLSIDTKSAKAEADTILRQHGLDPRSFYHATTLVDVTDAMANEYLRERIGIAAVNEIYAMRVPGALWRVRYFRDSQPEEFAVILRPDGTEHSWRHTLAEATAGATLGKEDAVARAEKFLREEKKIDLTQWSLVESQSEKRPHRLDHTLTWQESAALDGGTPLTDPNAADHAHARLELQVLGEEVTNYRTYVKIPEEWRRANEKLTVGRMVLSFGSKGIMFIGLGLFALIVFLRNLRSEQAHQIPWRRILLWGAWGLAAYLVLFALNGSRLLNLYQTTIPFKFMIATLGIGAVIGGAFYYGAIVLAFGVAYYFALRAFGEDELPGWSGMPAAYYRDALLIGLGGSLGIIGLSRLVKAVAAHWPTVHRAVDAVFGRDFDSLVPGPVAFSSAIRDGLLLTGLVCLAAAFVAACVRPAWLRGLLFVMGAMALVNSNWGDGADFARQFVAEAILLGALVLGVRWVMRFNLLGGFLAVAIMSIIAGIAELIGQPEALYRVNGYALVVGLVALLAWPVLAWQRAAKATG